MQIAGNIFNDHLGTKVREYRTKMDAAYKDETTQLKAARTALQEAYKSGDKDAIATAKQAVEDVQAQRHDNRAALRTLQGDVKQLREDRRQLEADVKAKNQDAIPQDRAAAQQAHDQILVDIQA